MPAEEKRSKPKVRKYWKVGLIATLLAILVHRVTPGLQPLDAWIVAFIVVAIAVLLATMLAGR